MLSQKVVTPTTPVPLERREMQDICFQQDLASMLYCPTLLAICQNHHQSSILLLINVKINRKIKGLDVIINNNITLSPLPQPLIVGWSEQSYYAGNSRETKPGVLWTSSRSPTLCRKQSLEDLLRASAFSIRQTYLFCRRCCWFKTNKKKKEY